MRQTICEAMKSLGEDGIVFGLENRQKGEDEFQLRLGKKLEQITGANGWTWRYWRSNEEKFETTALANESTIKVDIVGRHPERGMVAIELKYVPISLQRGGMPANPPAFPYDLAKDCLRLDLLRARECRPLGEPVPENLQTYVIGLTDWSDYWLNSKPKRGWAANFFSAIRSAPAPQFEGLIRTLGSNSENTIALGRCHIAFGRRWTGEWIFYGSGTETERFRYLFMCPDTQATPIWTHHESNHVDEQSATFPFLNRDAREGWLKRNAPKKRRRLRENLTE